MKTVTDWCGRVTSYEYDNNGNLTKTTRPNGSILTKTYDNANRVTAITDKTSGGVVINSYSYSYDADGNMLTENSTGSSTVNSAMTYDKQSKVLTRKNTNASGTTLSTDSYVYDADGNITTANEVNRTYNEYNLLQSSSYDEAGNMENANLGGSNIDFTFDYKNRLTQAGGTSYSYDAEDNRISSTVGGVTTNYVYDTTGSLSRMLESTDSTGKTVYYIYGMGLIGSEDNSGNYSNYHYDYRGSTTALTNSAGAVTDRYTYGTYGDLLSHTGSSTTPFLYNGRDGVMKESNGLYYMRSRYYSPELKRFINADVLKGAISSSETLNQYAYANGNPVSMVDPFGTSAEPGGSSTAATVGHTVLDVAGMVPVVGIPADIVSTAWYSAEGDWTNAGLSAVGIIPFIGDVGEAGKLGIKGVKLADEVSDAGKVAKGVKSVNSVVKPYEVSTFDDLIKRSVPNDGIEIHHVTQKHPAGQIIDGYNKSIAPSIALPRGEHRSIPNLRGDYSGSARELLTRDIQNLRNYTNVTNSSLKELIDLNKNMYPNAFKK